MLVEPPIEKLLPKVENRFDLSILVAKRNRELIDGAEPMVKEGDDESLVSIACREIAEDQVVSVPGNVEATVPLRESLLAEIMAEQEEETDADDWQSEGPDLEDELVPTPVSKIKVISEADMFEIPEDEDLDEEDDEGLELDSDDLDEEVPVKSKKKSIVEDEDEDEEDDEDFDLEDDDFESLDSSIDDFADDEDDDFLSGFENYDYDEDDL